MANSLEPIISVVVPVYKVEKYIKRCLESIVNQSYPHLEIILVEDGSPDNCGKICDEYAVKDMRIKVIHKENGGLSSARNTGLDHASGDYVAFVDSDDYICEDMYKILLDIIVRNHADIAQCGFMQVPENGKVEIHDNTNKSLNIYGNIEALENLYNENYVSTVVAWNKLYRRALFDDIRFPVGKVREDEFTTHKLLYKAKRIVNINSQMYYYVQTGNSIMRGHFNIKKIDYLDALEERLAFFKERNLMELYLKTESTFYYSLKNMYCRVSTHVKSNRFWSEFIKDKIKKNHQNFMRNPHIKYRAKVILALTKINMIFLDIYLFQTMNYRMLVEHYTSRLSYKL